MLAFQNVVHLLWNVSWRSTFMFVAWAAICDVLAPHLCSLCKSCASSARIQRYCRLKIMVLHLPLRGDTVTTPPGLDFKPTLCRSTGVGAWRVFGRIVGSLNLLYFIPFISWIRLILVDQYDWLQIHIQWPLSSSGTLDVFSQVQKISTIYPYIPGIYSTHPSIHPVSTRCGVEAQPLNLHLSLTIKQTLLSADFSLS